MIQSNARRGYDDAHRPARATAATKHGERAPTTGPLAGLRMTTITTHTQTTFTNPHLKARDLYTYETHIRQHRINTLTHFLTHLTPHAIREANPQGWYSRHVVWTLQRLEHLGYAFPEVDLAIEPHAAWNDRMRAA